ncbi:MAG TPA: hypothetical protein DCW68_00650 [Rhodospirillaceae bacterium]|nr:MAG: hypothetical protein A2018_00955 [Alphaproteobacteria bacterium GWF2_58_20]HAU28610.1 hypothetical protein [Rhodospirillaceae bacterium]
MTDAQSLILTASRSPELSAHFKAIAEMDVAGMPKYGRAEIHGLVRATVCRTYAPALLELAHLVAAASCLGAWENLFWGTHPVRASHFSAFFHEACGRGCLACKDGVMSIRYPDGQFSIRFGRMSFLSALMDMLVAVLGYDVVDDHLTSLRASSRTAADVSAAARGLAKAYYAFLKNHVPPAQGQRKFRTLATFMTERAGSGFSGRDIADDAILAFWQTHAADAGDGQDFKTYVATFRAFLHFLEALEQAERIVALEQARPVGTGEGEIDVAVGARCDLSEAVNPLEALCAGAGARVKFLNKQEQARLSLLFEAGTLALRLPVSLLRCEVFGKTQSRLTQGVRRGIGAAGLHDMARDGGEGDYLVVREELARLRDGLSRVLLASLFALVDAKSPEAISLLLDLAEGFDATVCAPLLKDMEGESLAERFLALLALPERAPPPLPDLMTAAEKAFMGLSRQGFEGVPGQDPELLEAFESGSPLVQAIRSGISGWLSATDAMDWPDLFIRDRETFLDVFSRIYGDAHVAARI